MFRFPLLFIFFFFELLSSLLIAIPCYIIVSTVLRNISTNSLLTVSIFDDNQIFPFSFNTRFHQTSDILFLPSTETSTSYASLTHVVPVTLCQPVKSTKSTSHPFFVNSLNSFMVESNPPFLHKSVQPLLLSLFVCYSSFQLPK